MTMVATTTTASERYTDCAKPWNSCSNQVPKRRCNKDLIAKLWESMMPNKTKSFCICLFSNVKLTGHMPWTWKRQSATQNLENKKKPKLAWKTNLSSTKKMSIPTGTPIDLEYTPKNASKESSNPASNSMKFLKSAWTASLSTRCRLMLSQWNLPTWLRHKSGRRLWTTSLVPRSFTKKLRLTKTASKQSFTKKRSIKSTHFWGFAASIWISKDQMTWRLRLKNKLKRIFKRPELAQKKSKSKTSKRLNSTVKVYHWNLRGSD